MFYLPHQAQVQANKNIIKTKEKEGSLGLTEKVTCMNNVIVRTSRIREYIFPQLLFLFCVCVVGE